MEHFDLTIVREEPVSDESFHTVEEYVVAPSPVGESAEVINISSGMSNISLDEPNTEGTEIGEPRTEGPNGEEPTAGGPNGGAPNGGGPNGGAPNSGEPNGERPNEEGPSGGSTGEAEDEPPHDEFWERRYQSEKEGWKERDFFYTDEELAKGTRIHRANGRTISWRARTELFEGPDDRIGVIYHRVVVHHQLSHDTTVCRRTGSREDQRGGGPVVTLPPSPEPQEPIWAEPITEARPVTIVPLTPSPEPHGVSCEEPINEVPLDDEPVGVEDRARPTANHWEDVIDLCASSDDELLGREEPTRSPIPTTDTTTPPRSDETTATQPDETITQTPEWPPLVMAEVERLTRCARTLPHTIQTLVFDCGRRYRVTANRTGVVKVRLLGAAPDRDQRVGGRRDRSRSLRRGVSPTTPSHSPIDLSRPWQEMPSDVGYRLLRGDPTYRSEDGGPPYARRPYRRR